jgi:hypothetical protein
MISSAATNSETPTNQITDEVDPTMEFYLFFRRLLDQGAKELLLLIVSGMEVTRDNEEKWDAVSGFTTLCATRVLTKTFKK